jgi:uncharacterized protein YjbI with pentapeptide repeats
LSAAWNFVYGSVANIEPEYTAPEGSLSCWGVGSPLSNVFGWSTGPSPLGFSQVPFSPGAALLRQWKGPTPTGEDYTYVDISGEDWTKVNLPSSTWGLANLAGTDFTGATLTGADFTGANLAGTIFTDATLDGANFSGATLANVNLSGASLLGTNFSGANLTDVVSDAAPKFSTDRTNPTNFSGATVPIAFIGTTTWTALNLSNATILNLPTALPSLNADYANLSGLSFSGIAMPQASFDTATLRGCDFSDCNLNSTIFSSAVCDAEGTTNACVFAGAYLMNAAFDSAVLTGVDFSGSWLWGSKATVVGATITLANFTDAYLAGVDFSGMPDEKCAGVVFDGACLVGATLGSNLIGYQGMNAVSFVGAALQGADFTGAGMAGVVLTNAAVATKNGTLKIVAPSPPSGMIPLPSSITYTATVNIPAASDSTTVCPDGEMGPCSGAKLVGRSSPMEVWRQGGTAVTGSR